MDRLATVVQILSMYIYLLNLSDYLTLSLYVYYIGDEAKWLPMGKYKMMTQTEYIPPEEGLLRRR